MTKVTVGLTMSVDGYIAGPDDGLEHPLGVGGEPLFDWFFSGDTPSRFGEMFKLDKVNAEIFEAGMESVGAVLTGRRTYDITHGWGGGSPVPGTPLFVLTHRAPGERPETSVPHTFVTDGIESAVRQARAAAGGRDVGLMGSGPVQECLRAGLLDEIHLSVAPMLLGGGVRLFDHLGGPVRLERTRVVEAPGVTHLSYRVAR
jgi:dihydrofolate reductase